MLALADRGIVPRPIAVPYRPQTSAKASDLNFCHGARRQEGTTYDSVSFTASARGLSLPALGYGVILPFDRAIQEFYTQAKAPSPVFAPGINHSSYLRKLTRRGGNKRFFARAPGPLADYAGTVGTDVFRNRSFTGAGFSQAGLRGRRELT